MKNHPILIVLFLSLSCLIFFNATILNVEKEPEIITEKANSNILSPNFDQLRQNLKNYVQTGQLAGIAALVFDKDQVLFSENFGFQNIENQTAITDQTIFRLASLTKPVVSVAILQLMESGKLKLDDPVEKHLPFFREVKVFETKMPPENTMTIAHLLTHTSGISSSFEQDEVGAMFTELTSKSKAKSLKEWVKEIAAIPLCSEPGTHFVYSHSTDVLGLIVEKVSGQRLDKFLKENLFEPLEMNNTTYMVGSDQLEHFATLYTLDEAGKLKAYENNVESKYVKGNFPRGNSGLAGTIRDYAKFAKMLLHIGVYNGKRILKESTVSALAQNQLSENQMPVKAGPMVFNGLGFGYGFAVSDGTSPLGKSPGTFGWIGATHTYCFVDPEREVVSLLFSQYAGRKPCPILFEFNGWVAASLVQED